MQDHPVVYSFTQSCKNFIAEGRFPQPELPTQENDLISLYQEYNRFIRTNVTDILERYMCNILRAGAKTRAFNPLQLKPILRSIISQCVENDLMKTLPYSQAL